MDTAPDQGVQGVALPSVWICRVQCASCCIAHVASAVAGACCVESSAGDLLLLLLLQNESCASLGCREVERGTSTNSCHDKVHQRQIMHIYERLQRNSW